jgi:hypothetical protein
MILRLFATVLFFGFAILLGILNVMRGLYASSTFQPPLIPSDSAAPVWVDDSHGQAREAMKSLICSIANPSKGRRARGEACVIPPVGVVVN